MKSLFNVVRRVQVTQPAKVPQVLAISEFKKVGGGFPRVGGLTGNAASAPPAGATGN